MEYVGTWFVFYGLLDGQSDRVTLVVAIVVPLFPTPVLDQGLYTMILFQSPCMWNDYFKLVDVCSVLGWASNGALSVGVQSVFANDWYGTMRDLRLVLSGAEVVPRQFMTTGCQPVELAKIDSFCVSMRVLMGLMVRVLNRSGGGAGAYIAPRSADGQSVLMYYMVIWASKLHLRVLMHLQQPYPAVVGMARIGVCCGLLVVSDYAQEIHVLVCSDTLFLLHGDRVQYIVGPLLEGRFLEFSHPHAQQVLGLQPQMQAQCQQLQGQLERQNHDIQALFETQLSHSCGLLSTRPSEEGERWGGRESPLPSCFPVLWLCSGVWWALMPVYSVLGFASMLSQDWHGFRTMIQMIAFMLAFSVCRIGVASHPGPDAGVSSFVLGVANPTGLCCQATFVSEHLAHNDFWDFGCLALPWCAQWIEATDRWMTLFSIALFRRQSVALDCLPVSVAHCHH